MGSSKRKFKSEIHLGVLAIVLLLLSLNFVSNLIIYRARTAKRQSVLTGFNNAALAVNRVLPDGAVPRLTAADSEHIKHEYRLSSLHIISAVPSDASIETRRQWFVATVRQFPPDHLPNLAQKLLASEFETLTRGHEAEYYYVTPLSSGKGRSLLILSRNIDDLAFLDDSHRVVVMVGSVAVLGILAICILLSRFIITPFRRIIRAAVNAGRLENRHEDDVDQIVDEYENIIAELRDKEQELLRLNKAIENRAESAEQFSQFLLDSGNSGVITTDTTGRLVTLNGTIKKLLRLTASDDEGKHFTEVLPDNAEIAGRLNEVLTSGHAAGYSEIDYDLQDHTSLRLGVTMTTVADSEGAFIGAALVINDLTEREQLRRELETKKRLAALGEMSGGLAHQLRNSLGAVAGYVRLLQKRLAKFGFDDPAVKELLDGTHEAKELTERFLQFARPLAARPIETPLREFLQEICQGYGNDDSTRLRFTLECPADVSVSIDPLLFRQAVTNLIDNAIDASPQQDTKIDIQVQSRTTETIILVRDYGCGIARDQIDNIFTPFYSSRPSGTGLGMPLAAKVIDLHGGRISVESVVGDGTTFRICLPRKSTDTVQDIDTSDPARSSV